MRILVTPVLIICTLITIVLINFAPYVGKFVKVIQDKDNQEFCVCYLNLIEKAFHDYDEYWGCLPPVWSSPKNSPETKLHSWRVLLLPFLGETELYNKIRLDEPWDSKWNKQFHDQCPSVYQCPGMSWWAKKQGKTSYVLFYGPNALFRGSYSLSFALLPKDDSQCRDPWGLFYIRYLIEQKKTVNWMNPEGDLSLSDNIFKKDNSLKSKYFDFHHYGCNEGVGFYSWCNALAAEGQTRIEGTSSLRKNYFDITEEKLRKPEDLDDLTRFYKIKTKLSDPMHPLPQELYLVGFTAKGVQVMGEAKIRYTVSRERFDPEEKQYLDEQYEREYQYYRDYLLKRISWNLPNDQTINEIPDSSSDKVEIRIEGDEVRGIYVPSTGEDVSYSWDSIDEWRRKNANQ